MAVREETRSSSVPKAWQADEIGQCEAGRLVAGAAVTRHSWEGLTVTRRAQERMDDP